MSGRVRKEKRKRESSKSPLLSLCMMVKNEEEMLPRCLESIKGSADEIIVVDTGSSDRTVEIAKSYGARIYHHAWENDFSKHRNQSISYATGDWILIMDADEEFYSEDVALLREVIQRSNADFIYLQCFDMEKTGKPHGVFNQVRLFRNGAGMHYTRCVHNQLQAVGRGFYSKLRFKHFGYDLDPLKMEAKHHRTTSLLLRRIEKDPGDPFNHFQLASSYSMHREYHKAIEQGEIALLLRKEKDLRNAYFSTVYYTVAQAHFALGMLQEAEGVCLEAIDFFAMDLNAYHLLAAIRFKAEDFQKCKDASLRYLAILQKFEEDPSEMRGVYFNSYGKKHEIYYGLAFINFAERQFDRAEEYFDLAFQLQGRSMEKALEISRFYLDGKMERKAFQWIEKACERGFRDIVVMESFIARCATRMGWIETRKILEQTTGAFSEWPEYWALVASLCREGNDPETAIRYYKKSIDLNPSEHKVFMKSSDCYERGVDLANAVETFEEYLNGSWRDERNLLRMAGLQLRRQDFKTAAQWLKQIEGHDLDGQQEYEKKMMDLTVNWGVGDFDEFLRRLEEMMQALNMATAVTIDSAVQLGRILYEMTEVFCEKGFWQTAELGLRLALLIAPDAFPAERLESLLSSLPRSCGSDRDFLQRSP